VYIDSWNWIQHQTIQFPSSFSVISARDPKNTQAEAAMQLFDSSDSHLCLSAGNPFTRQASAYLFLSLDQFLSRGLKPVPGGLLRRNSGVSLDSKFIIK